MDEVSLHTGRLNTTAATVWRRCSGCYARRHGATKGVTKCVTTDAVNRYHLDASNGA